MMPLFMANFGSTLDALGGPVTPGPDEETIVEQVASFAILFVVIGIVSAGGGFIMVTLWSISGERQVTFPPLPLPLSLPWLSLLSLGVRW